MLTGLARPDEGSIFLSGIDCIKDIKKAQHKIGIVPDESNLYDEMNGFDNLAFCASLYGIEKKEREKRSKELLKVFGLADTGKKPFKAYSKGMKRKLTIAAGIIHQPEILFLDEPTTGIDVESARQIRKLISIMNEKGTTIFMTTHYIEEAERLCNRIGFIVQGKIVRTGTVEEMMQEVQTDNIIQFSVDKDLKDIQEKLIRDFPGFVMEPVDSFTVRIHSDEKVSLMPFMQFFDDNSYTIHEAKIIKPSLEEVFVKVTGIGIDKMKEEKEGGKKK
jgi:ABC-2 type transport system ATP-binding protein